MWYTRIDVSHVVVRTLGAHFSVMDYSVWLPAVFTPDATTVERCENPKTRLFGQSGAWNRKKNFRFRSPVFYVYGLDFQYRYLFFSISIFNTGIRFFRFRFCSPVLIIRYRSSNGFWFLPVFKIGFEPWKYEDNTNAYSSLRTIRSVVIELFTSQHRLHTFWTFSCIPWKGIVLKRSYQYEKTSN